MSEGYCDVSFDEQSDDVDPVDFACVTTPTARKEHRCWECKGSIMPGEKYQRIATKFDDSMQVFKRCSACAEVAAEFDYNIYGGDLWEAMKGEWNNGANVQGCIARLTTVKAKELMRRLWAKWKGIEP